MKRSLKLFNKKGKKPRRKQDIIDLDDDFTEDDFEEEYDDGYDEDDYPDEEFEQEYGDSDEEDEDSDAEYADVYEDEYVDEENVDEEDFGEDDDNGADYGDEDIEEPQGIEERYESDDDYREEDYADDFEEAEKYTGKLGPSDAGEALGDDHNYDNIVDFNACSEQSDTENEQSYRHADEDAFRDEEDDYYRDEDAEYEEDLDENYDDEPVEWDDELAEGDDEPVELNDESVEGHDDESNDEYGDEFDDYENESDEGYEDDYEEDYEEDYDADEDDYPDEYDEEDAIATSSGRIDRRSKGRNGRDDRNGVAAAAAAVGGKVASFVKESSFVERAAVIAGILILVAAAVTVSFYSKALGRTREINEFVEVGTNLNTNDVVGAVGLIAVADAERAKAMAAAIVEEPEDLEEEEVDVPDDAENVIINMALTSIKSDIKVKFVNSESGKLVANVPFVISVVNPDGTTVTYDDHDRDGIIYKKDMTAGKYTITPSPLPAEYSNYNLDTSAKTLTVKDVVEMKAVDVSNEIKKESQVNVAKEDTAVQTVVESELKDTVDWDGESYVTDGEGDDANAQYEEINKDDVDPASFSGKLPVGSIMHLSAARAENEELDQEQNKTDESSQENSTEENKNSSQENASSDNSGSDNNTVTKEKLEFTSNSYKLTIDGTEQLVPTKGSGISYFSDNENVATVDANGLITAKGAGSATIVASADNYESGYISVTVTEKQEEKKEGDTKTIPISSSKEMSVEVGKTVSITSSDSSLQLSYSSDNVSVAAVDGNNVQGISEGKCKITVKCEGYEDAYVDITVVAATDTNTVPLGITSFTIHERKTEKITSTDSSLALSFRSDNSDVASVSEEGVITAVKEGTATITVSAEGYADAKVSVTVIHKELKDKSGNTLYVLEDGNYRVAVYADYDTAEKFYRRVAGEKKYHGWANINGLTYFFDNSGTMVTGEQIIGGAKYTFGSDGVLSTSSGTMGIDVSKWNGNIDWNKVKNSGVNYVIIRCGYRGSSEGALIEDPKFKANIKGATAAGLKVGVYFFTQAVNEVEAVEEASMCINLIRGYSLSFPVYIDVEASNGRADSISASQRTANIKAFCGTIQNAGYTAGVYANRTWFTSKINTAQITGYKIWLAQYAASVSYNASRYDMWQYTSKGSIQGITGKVDMNILYR